MISSLLRNFKSRTPWFVANFDSCSALVKALANYLHGYDFSGVGGLPGNEHLARFINALPWEFQKRAYVKGSSHEALDPEKTGKVRAEEFSEWATGLYPKRKYSTILIGSANGAAVHLGAAIGAPWLPQTFMIPVKAPENLSIDEPKKQMEWAKKPAEDLLKNNKDLQLHHMMDPSQDRPMLDAIAYFRVKRLQLGEAYKKFITEHLEKHGTILIIGCQKTWLGKKVGDRHFFQFGGLGGITPEEYYKGSDEITEFLKKEGSAVLRWDAPQPDGEIRESEWGFEPKLKDDIYNFASEHDYKVQRLIFNEPEDLSPFVADLYHWWYGEQHIIADTLIADMFFLIDPYWTIRTGSVPFWLAFNAKYSINRLKQYVQQNDNFDNIYMLPFSNGVEASGIATEEDLMSALALAKKSGNFIGSKPHKYPYDFGIFLSYQKDFKKKIMSRYPTAPALTLQQLQAFFDNSNGKYEVKIEIRSTDS